MLMVVVIVAIVSIAGLVASVLINSLAVALTCVGLCALGLILLVIGTVRGRRRRVAGSAETVQALPVEHPHRAGDYFYGELEVAREFVREERVLSRDMLGYDVPHEESILDIHHAL